MSKQSRVEATEGIPESQTAKIPQEKKKKQEASQAKLCKVRGITQVCKEERRH